MQLRATKPIAELKDSCYNNLRKDLEEFIFITSDFPGWKQVNFADTWAELSIKKLSTTLTVDEQATLGYIASVRAWKNDLLTERDRVKAEIFAETATVASIKASVESFNYIEKPIQ